MSDNAATSATKAQRGLAIERRFTRPGVHPYEEVEWETRDALIGDPEKPAFLQRDVEVPKTWSQNATNIVAQKYFRGGLESPDRERSVRQMLDRVAGTIAEWGRVGSYFASAEDADAFEAELTAILLRQIAAFNSPVWFNVGWRENPQCSACFILSVEDTMESILDWNTKEGIIFKGGSGSGINLSKIRGSMEPLAKGGIASGPVSFMRGADSWAGAIKSGGGTRRAAKMVILNADHPDIEEFIWCKALEEDKALALREAGFDMSIDGAGFSSVQFQNANNSVRVTDEFMKAVENDEDWDLLARTDASVIKTVKARDLMNQIAEAAWRCADPGFQYDTTINRWHTNPETGPITGSNPCFPGDARVHTTSGLLPIAELHRRYQAGEDIHVYTHRMTAGENGAAPRPKGTGVLVSTPVAVMQTGIKPILNLRFSNGATLRCTPSHKIWTRDAGYVEAQQLNREHEVALNDSATPAADASWELPVKVEELACSRKRGAGATYAELPTRWSPELAELTGHLIGDGSLTDVQTNWIYGDDDLRDGLADRHETALTQLLGGISRQEMTNGTVQLRAGSSAVRELFRGLGVTSSRAHLKRVPDAVFTAPPEVQASFLRGLFGADGCVSQSLDEAKASRYVGLGSRSKTLLKDVQKILSSFGIRGRIYSISGSDSSRFSYTRNDGTVVHYDSKPGFDLRITGSDLERFATEIGFSTPRKNTALAEMLASTSRYSTKPGVRLVSREEDGQELVYNLTEPIHHSYLVDGFVVANCSEYMSIDDSACNLASLNLMKFRREDGSFAVEDFVHAVDIVFLAQEILVGFSSYPTEKITQNARDFRQLGLGYANLGALLMSNGLPYDSDEGRNVAAAITSLMTGRAYKRSAEVAEALGPYEGYAVNREAHNNVMRMHRDAAYEMHGEGVREDLLEAARKEWDVAVELGEGHGYRNAQASVLAPTGCLVGDSLVLTSRGLVRLNTLGNPDGPKWQDLDVQVATDEGPKQATDFYINGYEQVVSIETSRGYRIQGTPTHRIKVIDATGKWAWRRFAEIEKGDRVPLMMNGIVGEPQEVQLPPLGELHWNADFRTRAPRAMTPELAEFLGYFMGDGSLHAKGIRLCVTAEDRDVLDHLVELGRDLFGLEARVSEQGGYTEVAFNSVPLTIWWEACGFAKQHPAAGHSGKGWHAHIPNAVLHSNDPKVYSAFIRGLWEADGTTKHGYASWSTVTERFSRDVQTMLLALGYVTTRKVDGTASNWGAHERYVLRVLNRSEAGRFCAEIGFISARKQNALAEEATYRQAARHNHVPVRREMVDQLAPDNDSLRKTMLMSLSRRGDVSRRAATALLERTADPDLKQLLGFFYDDVASIEVLDDQPTFDISVPDNVTYVANGFVSHNTISFLMDCDTTGIEPDFSLVKYKELVGGGNMTIVNRSVGLALETLGYSQAEIDQIVAFIDEQGTILGAPALKDEHLPVFDVAVGKRAISHTGHIDMMAATQPFISGAISKTVNLPESASVADIADAYTRGWTGGLKALAIYRDGSKTAQALRTDAQKEKEEPAAAGVTAEIGPVRRRMPVERESITHKFSIAGHEGYITAGKYEDGTVGEIFLTDIGKEGSTLRGMLNAFATAISLGLQYGVPLEVFVRKFSYMRFDPEGITQNPEIPFAKSMPDYIMRWLASRFIDDLDELEDLGIMTSEVRAKKEADIAQLGLEIDGGGSAGPTNGNGNGNGGSSASGTSGKPVAPTTVLTDTPPVRPARLSGPELGPACDQCGGMMQRTGACYTCSSCGNNTGCG